MATAPTIDAGTRFAFAPREEPDGLLYCIYIAFESSRGDLFCVRTQLTSLSLDAADDMCDAPNSHLDLTREQWKHFSSTVFILSEKHARERAASDTQAVPPDDPDEYYDPDEPSERPVPENPENGHARFDPVNPDKPYDPDNPVNPNERFDPDNPYDPDNPDEP